MAPGEKREYWGIHRQKSRKSHSMQKVTSDRMTDIGRKAESRQSTIWLTVYRTVNLIKEHMSESPRTYVDIVNKLTTSTTPKRRTKLECRATTSKGDKKMHSYHELAYAAKKGKLTYRDAMSLGISNNVYHRVAQGRIRRKKSGTTILDKL